jgi:hypothetical protein
MATPADEGVTRAVEWVAGIAGPLTATTAVLYFFGWTRTSALFRFFGVDPAILEFDAADYLARAAGPAFVPATGLLVGGALLYALSRVGVLAELYCLRHPVTFKGRSFVVRVPSIALLYIGLITLWCAVRVALGLHDYLSIGASIGITEPIPAALALAGGSIILAIGLRLTSLRPESGAAHASGRAMPPRILLLAVVLVAVFWATAAYSQRAGEDLAAYINENPASYPEVTVYSEESIGLWSASPPTRTDVDPQSERFRYVYTGLRLLIYANERWLLLTGERNVNGRLIVAILRDDDRIQVRLSA